MRRIQFGLCKCFNGHHIQKGEDDRDRVGYDKSGRKDRKFTETWRLSRNAPVVQILVCCAYKTSKTSYGNYCMSN